MLTRFKGLNLLCKTMVVIGLIILLLALSFCTFAVGYWLITLILMHFFNFVLPFTVDYVIGGWLILLIIYVLILPNQIKINLD